MDLIEKYYGILEGLCNIVKNHNIITRCGFLAELIEYAPESLAEAISLRQTFGILEEEVKNFHIISEVSSLYDEFEDKDAAFCVALDLLKILKASDIAEECRPYNIEKDKIFSDIKELKKLVSVDNELIKINDYWDKDNLRIIKINTNTSIKLTNRINPNLINYLFQKYSNNEIYVRIEKNKYGNQIIQSINEDVLRTEASKWYKNLLIYNGEHKMGEYKSKDTNGTKEHLLQTFFKRNNDDLLSGAIEEILLNQDDILICKYLHLTSKNKVGSEWREASLSHIDGAINVYLNKNISNRLQNKLDTKIKANYRTHLFRIDNIPMTEILPIAYLFFDNENVVKEWINDSFEDNESNTFCNT